MKRQKTKAGRNRTLEITSAEREALKADVTDATLLNADSDWVNKTICGDATDTLARMPDHFADLIIVDPPYNLSKKYGERTFRAMKDSDYEAFLESWLPLLCRKLKPGGSLYMCGDWKCTSAMQRAMEKHLTILNRITWQREKGRGAKKNWKNGMEDIWFAVKNKNDYYFDVDAVKQKRRVIAPYKVDGMPKGWEESDSGNFRLTCPSNFWDDISIPFWSMPENTDHPTQKPEKLMAKLILASSKEGDMVLDPFLGSGTTSVVARKLGRNYCGIEADAEYCLYAAKRLKAAEADKTIQGYGDGVFWERNSQAGRKTEKKKTCRAEEEDSL